MVLIQILLPAQSTSSTPANDRFAITRDELVERFGGVTAYVRSPAQGVWTDGSGAKEQDSMIMVEVVTERFDKAWWRPYARRLAARFGEEVIHVRALPADLLEPEAS